MNDPADAMSPPIQMHNTGKIYTVTFPNAGFYPFYVPMHDAKMLGTIQVL